LPDRHVVDDTTRATARLPGLDIEIIHRRSPDNDSEQLSINLQAVPSFEAFGQFLDRANPFAFWIQAAQLMWLPWLGATRGLAALRDVRQDQSRLSGPEENGPPASRPPGAIV
jgi:hypothetical protein